ncbi:hypothetical protein O9X98_10295 [Agrobacterium salinitolerans]|nr:hypothetical protein [Agrobacterium salinitolerans]
MHIKLPYAFQITGKVPGTRRMDRVIASDWLTVNVASVGYLDAPICLSWTREAAYNFFENHAVGPEGRVDIRTFDGNFYRPLTQVGDSLKADDLAGTVLIDYRMHSDDKAEELSVAQKVLSHFPENRGRPDFVGETFSNEQDIVDALTKRAEGLLFVDGTVWERCLEPVLVLEEDFVRHNTIYISPAFTDKYKCGSREEYFTFAIDELDEAVAFAQNRTSMPEDLDITVCAQIEVRAPEMLSRGHLANDVLRHAEKSLRESGKVDLNRAFDGSSGYMRRWLAAFDALAFAKITPEDAHVEILLETWVDFAEESRSLAAEGADYKRGIAHSLQSRFADRTMEPEAIFGVGPKL